MPPHLLFRGVLIMSASYTQCFPAQSNSLRISQPTCGLSWRCRRTHGASAEWRWRWIITVTRIRDKTSPFSSYPYIFSCVRAMSVRTIFPSGNINTIAVFHLPLRDLAKISKHSLSQPPLHRDLHPCICRFLDRRLSTE
jgi:hypothetical protein